MNVTYVYLLFRHFNLLYLLLVINVNVKVYCVLCAGDNACKNNNGGCSQLCVYIGNDKARCLCAYGRVVNKTQCEGE